MTGVALLDLNYTLVENSSEVVRPFTRQIEVELYRGGLVAALAGWRVILVTARPKMYEAATLASIKSKLGWVPDEWYFNDLGWSPAPFKQHVLLDHILSRFEKHVLLAIESNPRTRSMYARNGVRAKTWDEFMRAGADLD